MTPKMRPQAKVERSIIRQLVEAQMGKQRRQFGEQFKFKVALEATKGNRTVNEIVSDNQVWSADITYIPMPTGFMYLVAIIDWFSRFVLAWQVSNILDGLFCRDALQQALTQGKPDIFNTDKGAQFTAHEFTGMLDAVQIHISMDGRGRALDNIFIERLWRSVKHEDIYVEDVPALDDGLNAFFQFYNYERPHQSLDYCTPAMIHFGTQEDR